MNGKAMAALGYIHVCEYEGNPVLGDTQTIRRIAPEILSISSGHCNIEQLVKTVRGRV